MASFSTLLLGLVATAGVSNAHALLSNFFVNNVNQGEGVCIREATSINPKEVGTTQLTCGNDSPNTPSMFTCPVPAQANLTFEFRRYPDRSETNIDGDWFFKDDHWGPCAVYMKRMSDTMDDDVSGGWFKIMDDPIFDGEEWCTHRVKNAGGLLSVQIPPGLPAGPYLVRPELLALHQSAIGVPQFFTACVQIYVQSNVVAELEIPGDHIISIPSPQHCSVGDPRCTVQKKFEPPSDYKAPGPQAVNLLADGAAPSEDLAFKGLTPQSCAFIKDEWCYPQPTFRNTAQCESAVAICKEDELKECLRNGRRTGGEEGDLFCEKDFMDYCGKLEQSCPRGSPPVQRLVPFTRPPPGPVPGWLYKKFDALTITVSGVSKPSAVPSSSVQTKEAENSEISTSLLSSTARTSSPTDKSAPPTTATTIAEEESSCLNSDESLASSTPTGTVPTDSTARTSSPTDKSAPPTTATTIAVEESSSLKSNESLASTTPTEAVATDVSAAEPTAAPTFGEFACDGATVIVSWVTEYRAPDSTYKV